MMWLLVMGSRFHEVFRIWTVKCPERADFRERDKRQHTLVGVLLEIRPQTKVADLGSDVDAIGWRGAVFHAESISDVIYSRL